MERRQESLIYEKVMSDKFFNIYHNVLEDSERLDFHVKAYGDYIYFCFGQKSLLNSVCIYNAFAVKRNKKCGRCENQHGEVSFIQVEKDRSLTYYCSECFIEEFFGILGLSEEPDEISIEEIECEIPALSHS